MRIFSKKAFAIGEGYSLITQAIDSFITVPNTFQEMPDKYKNDPTFKLAVKCGDIVVSTAGAKEFEKEIENEKEPELDPVELYFEKLRVMDRDGVMGEAEKYGVVPEANEKMGAFKRRILEAYKLTLQPNK